MKGAAGGYRWMLVISLFYESGGFCIPPLVTLLDDEVFATKEALSMSVKPLVSVLALQEVVSAAAMATASPEKPRFLFLLYPLEKEEEEEVGSNALCNRRLLPGPKKPKLPLNF